MIGADYLLDALRALRWAWVAETGLRALPWQEMHAYGLATGEVTEAWEYHALSAMSAAYCRGRQIGEHQFGRFPWHEDDPDDV